MRKSFQDCYATCEKMHCEKKLLLKYAQCQQVFNLKGADKEKIIGELTDENAKVEINWKDPTALFK